LVSIEVDNGKIESTTKLEADLTIPSNNNNDKYSKGIVLFAHGLLWKCDSAIS
jgi:hypothetical protein